MRQVTNLFKNKRVILIVAIILILTITILAGNIFLQKRRSDLDISSNSIPAKVLDSSQFIFGKADSVIKSQVPLSFFGTNGYSALDLNQGENDTYIQSMKTMNPGSVRMHYGGMLEDSSTDSRGWIKESDKDWDYAKLTRFGNMVKKWRSAGFNPEIEISIPNFPTWMRDDNSRLKKDQYQAYANLCSKLVTELNTNQKLGLKYFEVTNELDNQYYVELVEKNQPDQLQELAKIYITSVKAMKQADPNIKTGGPAFARPDLEDGVKKFIDLTINESSPKVLDYLSYHTYYSGSADDAIDPILVSSEEYPTYLNEYIKGYLSSAYPTKPVDLRLNEFNISWTWETYDDRMGNHKGAVFDALSYMAQVKSGYMVTNSWNDADGIYGKLSSENYSLEAGGELLALMTKYGVGE